MTGKVGAQYDGKVGAGHDGGSVRKLAGMTTGLSGKGGQTATHKELRHNNLHDIRAPLWRHAVYGKH